MTLRILRSQWGAPAVLLGLLCLAPARGQTPLPSPSTPASPTSSPAGTPAPGTGVSEAVVQAEDSFEVEGLLLPSFESEVAAPSQGLVEKVIAKEGQPVKTGDILVNLNTEVQNLQYRLAQATHRKAKGEYEAAGRLHAERLLSRDEFNRAKLAYEQADAELEYASLLFDRSRIKAPADGFVLRILKQEGESAQMHEHVATVVTVDPLSASALLPERYLGRVAKGKKATVQVHGHGHPMEGTIDMVDPVVEPGTEVFRIKVLLPNPKNKIPSGTKATLRIPLNPDATP